jgi:predicted AAA+ superfamily ATPase
MGKGNRKIYKCKDLNGNYREFYSVDIKNKMKAGDSFPALKISADNRLIERTDSGKRIMRDSETRRQSRSTSGFQVYTGADLIELVNRWTTGRQKRDGVDSLLEALKENSVGRVYVVKGIRRTGKTTAIMHTIGELIKDGIDASKIVYMTITDGAYTKEVLMEMENRQCDYLFVDEITLLHNVISRLKFLADTLSVYKKIILAGTDSYVWPVAAMNVLYDRQITIDMTYMSFKEYCRLFPLVVQELGPLGAVDDFCVSSGVVRRGEYRNFESAYVNMQSALVENIIQTIYRNKSNESVAQHAGELYTLNREQMIEAIISAILMVVKTQNSKHLRLENIKIPESAAKILKRQGITKSAGINKKAAQRLVHALRELKIIELVENLAKEFEDGVKIEGEYEFVCHINGLYNTIIGRSESEKISGIALENMILSQCVQMANRKTEEYSSKYKLEQVVVKYCRYRLTPDLLQAYGESNSTPELDLVVQKYGNEGIKHTCVIEVKRSSNTAGHAKNMFLATMKKAIGSGIDKCMVVYTGNTQKIREVWYVNAYDFLMDIERWTLQ